MYISNDPIPKEKFAQWFEIFSSTSGRFTSGVMEYKDHVRVSYTFNDPDDYRVLNEAYARITTPIVEVQSPWWKRLVRRVKALLA